MTNTLEFSFADIQQPRPQPQFAVPEIKILRLCETTAQCMECGDDAVIFWRDCVEPSPWFEADRECIVAAAVNIKGKLISWKMLSVGTLDQSTLHPRDIFRFAVVASAHSFILMHNHPSGNPEPSSADITITRQLREAGKLMQIQLRDHVIVGTDSIHRYYSFRESEAL